MPRKSSLGMDEALRRIENASRSNEVELNLSDLDLTEVPPSVALLSNLQSLKLSNNEIETIPNFLSRLANLQTLVMEYNKILSIPESLCKLSGLQELNLHSNQIESIPDSLGDLSNLHALYLGSNHLTTIPNSLARLTNLEGLFLHDNGLTAIPDFFVRLSSLRQFSFGRLLEAIPDFLSQLTNLRGLVLNNNRLTVIPDSLAELPNLEDLHLSHNKLAFIPDSVGRLSRLQGLYVGGNQITSIPSFLSRLSNLRILSLDQNQITSIPDSIGALSSLEVLSLQHNEIRSIPAPLTQLSNLGNLDLAENPLSEELSAALKRGIPSFFRYLNSVSKVYPRTIKLVLLGEPKSGKTTLVEALKGNPTPCDESRKETLGVNVATIEKLHPTDQQPMALSVWDFAGQHIEHATHQFFLTENAIYLILWNARMGPEAGKRDLWYWLELLKMRVRDPKFLLVATHTEHTPPDLNLSEIQRSYPGCLGQLSVDLLGLKGFAALQETILKLAAQSPALQAAWPALWLHVRDEIRKVRAQKPYMTPSAFRALLNRKRVRDEQDQKDLSNQLHNLGEILYFQERDELSSLVILNPEWVTELIALVVRSEEVRATKGILKRSDLDKLWKKYNLTPAVRDHLIRLMDWFDLTFSTEHRSELGIVVEALPYSTTQDQERISLPSDQPQMEMIYRFPSLQRHLPPGIPTWGIARAHRFSKCTPWRDAAAFEDKDSNTSSQALILASDSTKEVRLRVSADYPPFFFGRMEAILRDTFKRYSGAEPERHLPCRCRPDCTSSHNYEAVIKRYKDGKTHISCNKSGEDVLIDSLLSGARASDTEQGRLALLAEMRRVTTTQMQALRETMENTCPSVFTLVPAKDFKLLDTWFESATQVEEMELALYCEHDSGWHPTSHSLYRFRPNQEWFDFMKRSWNQFAGITKKVAPLAKTVGKAAGATWPLIEAGAAIAEKLPLASHSPTAELFGALGRRSRPEFVDFALRDPLKRLIEELDSKHRPDGQPNGGLFRLLIDDGRVLWLCPNHRRLYQTRPS